MEKAVFLDIGEPKKDGSVIATFTSKRFTTWRLTGKQWVKLQGEMAVAITDGHDPLEAFFAFIQHTSPRVIGSGWASGHTN